MRATTSANRDRKFKKRILKYRSSFEVDEKKQIIYGDITQMENADISPRFDLVICTFVLEHVSDPVSASKALFQLMRYNGVVLIIIPFIELYHAIPMDYNRFTLDGASQLMRNAGFEIEKTALIGDGLLTMGFFDGYGSA